MGTTLNRHAYQRLIDEDLDWLLKQPRSLEHDHIEAIVRVSLHREYVLRDAAEAALPIVDWYAKLLQDSSNRAPVEKVATQLRAALHPQPEEGK